MRENNRIPIKAICPVCSCQRAHVLYSVDSKTAAGHFTGGADEQRFKEMKDRIEALWNRQRCDFVRCTNCSFCYAQPYVEADSKFYELVYDQPGYPSWKWEYQITYEALERMRLNETLKDLKLLEIGSGDGAFVKKVAPALTSKANVVCVEYSNYGRAEIDKYGIRCLSEDIRSSDWPEYENYFDVVCMFQVLEHMARIDDVFESINRYTAQSADLFIAVPNSRQREFYDLNGIVEDLPPTHIGRWNQRCFETVIARHGWTLVRHEFESQEMFSKIVRFVDNQFRKAPVLAQRIAGIQNRYLRWSLRRMAWFAYSLLYLRQIGALIMSNELGVSQWVHLKKRSRGGGPVCDTGASRAIASLDRRPARCGVG